MTSVRAPSPLPVCDTDVWSGRRVLLVVLVATLSAEATLVRDTRTNAAAPNRHHAGTAEEKKLFMKRNLGKAKEGPINTDEATAKWLKVAKSFP